MTFELDEPSARQIVPNEVAWQVAPAQTGGEKITLGAEIVNQPLALARDTLLGLFRSRLIVRDDDLNVPAKLVHRDGLPRLSQRVGWRAHRHHL